MDDLRSILEALTREACDTLKVVSRAPKRPWVTVYDVGRYSMDMIGGLGGVIQARKWSARPPEDKPDFLSTTYIHSLAPRIYMDTSTKDLFAQLIDVVEGDPRFSHRSGLDWRSGNPAQKGRQARFLESLVLPFLRTYYYESQSNCFDAAAFDRAFRQAQLRPPTPLSAVRLVIPLLNAWVWDDPIELSVGVKLRRVAAREIEDWLNLRDNAPLSLGFVPSTELLAAPSVLEVTGKGRMGERVECDELLAVVEKALSTLRLLKPHPIHPLLVEYQVLGLVWYRRGFSPYWSSTYRSHLPIPFAGAEESELRNIYDGITCGRNRRLVELALRRWNGAWGRSRNDDRLVDYWIALESLFCPESVPGRIKATSASRIGAFLGTDSTGSEAIYRDMLLSYKLRSDVVHGDRHANLEKTAGEIGKSFEEAVDMTGSWLREALVRIIQSKQAFDCIR